MTNTIAAQLSPDEVIRAYLVEHSKEFGDIIRIKEKHQSWESVAAGRKFMSLRRGISSTHDESTQQKFYRDMRALGLELDEATGAFSARSSPADKPFEMLDLGMAPGGFATVVLEKHPDAIVRGITLRSGHKMRLPDLEPKPNVDILYRNISCLAAEMGIPAPGTTGGFDFISATHPEAAEMFYQPPFNGMCAFDLVVCDAELLHPDLPAHSIMSTSAAQPGAFRLMAMQLLLALRRVREGGTIILLLLAPHSWDAVRLLYVLENGVADRVLLFKSERFAMAGPWCYAVLQGIHPNNEQGQKLQNWLKLACHAAALEREFGDGMQVSVDAAARKALGGRNVREVLSVFGPRFMVLATPAWRIQLDEMPRYGQKACNRGELLC